MCTTDTSCYVAWNGYVWRFLSMSSNFTIVPFLFLFMDSEALKKLINVFFIVGDFCCNPLSLGRIKTVIEDSVPGIYVNSLKIGSSIVEASILFVTFWVLWKWWEALFIVKFIMVYIKICFMFVGKIVKDNVCAQKPQTWIIRILLKVFFFCIVSAPIHSQQASLYMDLMNFDLRRAYFPAKQWTLSVL